MAHLLIGTLPFLLMGLMDWASLHPVRSLKPLLSLLAGALFVIAWIGVVIPIPPTRLPATAGVVGWIGVALFTCLLAFSLLVEIPLQSAYLKPGAEHHLVTTGTYALSRHPGFLWFGGLMASTALIHPSGKTLLAGTVWLTADLLLIWIEDRVLFPRMFPRYRNYQHSTPFLIPTRASLRRCLATLPGSARNKPTGLDLDGGQSGGSDKQETQVESF